jgi:hypothetical protein
VFVLFLFVVVVAAAAAAENALRPKQRELIE